MSNALNTSILISQYLRGGECMKGSISFRVLGNGGWFYVNWYWGGKDRKIAWFNGQRMYSRDRAEKCRACMQAEEERGVFRLEKWLSQAPCDVIPYMTDWLNDIGPTLKAATLKDYKNSIKNHLIPFFRKNPANLNEIDSQVLTRLLNSIKRGGKGKLNVMYCLRACLDYANRAGKITGIPPFPKKKQYQIPKKKPIWIPEERQIRIILTIPEEHQAPFWWLKYHYRRPGEAQALHKTDLKRGSDGYFWHIHRTFSARSLTDTTKSGYEHEIPMVQAFKPWLDKLRFYQKKWRIVSPYFFVNPTGHKPGKYYTHPVLSKIWRSACEKCGEHIKLYPGTKHSSCGQFLNEKGGNISELQSITDHARIESVENYGEMELARRRALMERGRFENGKTNKTLPVL